MMSLKLHHSSLLVAAVCAAMAQVRPLKFAGEVKAGDDYEYAIGHDLYFRLRAQDNGWIMDIGPTAERAKECSSYAGLLLFPLRGPNELQINTSWGRQASKVIGTGLRTAFEFVVSPDQCKHAREMRTRLLWPYTFTEKEVEEAQTLTRRPTGKALFRVVDCRITSGGEEVGGVDLGKIDWIKFDVTITFPKKP